jgi:hypothetical protein
MTLDEPHTWLKRVDTDDTATLASLTDALEEAGYLGAFDPPPRARDGTSPPAVAQVATGG